MAKQSGHQRKRWKTTWKLPDVRHGKTGKPVELEVNEFTIESMGWDIGAGLNRAFKKLREKPEMFQLSLRKAFVSIQCVGDYTIAQEAAEKAAAGSSEAEERIEAQWFGRPWNPHFCTPERWVPTPINQPCVHCEKPIEASDSGVVYANGPVAHLACFLDSLEFNSKPGDHK